MNDQNSKVMRKSVYIGMLLLLFFGCNNEEEIKSLLPDIALEETYNLELTATEFSEYILKGNLQEEKLPDYPINIWSNQGWKVRHWGKVDAELELKDIIYFLKEEKSKFIYSSENQKVVGKIDDIIGKIKDKSGKYFVSYFYKEKPGESRKPPSSDENYTGWLFFYYLDLESQQITRITNAYR